MGHINVMANVMGIVKASNAVFPDATLPEAVAASSLL